MNGMPSKKNDKLAQFERLILPHLDAAANLARWLSKDSDMTQDLVQETYLRAYKSFDSFTGENGRAWLFAIVRNTFYTLYGRARARGEEEAFDEDLHTAPGSADALWAVPVDPQAVWERHSQQALVQRLIESLPCEYREVLVLREVEELSYRDIAHIVGIPPGTVMSRLARARALLQKKLLIHERTTGTK